MAREAFLREEGGAFAPNEYSRGYWRDDSIHGRSLVGLLGQEIERRHGQAGWIPARFNVDMHRLAKFRPLKVETRSIRDGGRLRLIEAALTQDGLEVARAQCQFLRTGEAPEGRVWSPEPWGVSPPAELAPLDDPKRMRLAEWRPISGEMGTCGQRRIWTREFFDIVEGVPLTPFARVAVGADFGSPWIHSGDAGIKYINTDIVVQLHRLPRGEWLGLESTGHEASQAIAVGNCRFYDEDGPLGYISATALSNERR
ncbi:MAG: thioesterase family protein [Novosphingobium sp.]|nr:thioesterase family protein [Novosphingobium sp.]